MSRSDFNGPHRPLGIAAVGIIGSLLLFVTAGIVLWGQPARPFTLADGALRDYGSSPTEAWTADEQSLPDYTGSGPIVVADRHGDDWLLSYPSGIGRAFTLVDAGTGTPRWQRPVRAGLGDCAINVNRTVGCAIKLGDEPDGFYLIGDDGALRPAGPLDDTVDVTAVGADFLRVNQFGRQAVLRTPDGRQRWSRSFAATASPRTADGLLVVDVADGSAAILDPRTGESRIECADCTFTVYPGGVLAVGNRLGQASVQVYPRTAQGVATRSVRTADSVTVARGPAILPVLAATGPDQVMADSGRYEIIDPATGDGLWQITDPDLSKSNTRPCGEYLAIAKKDRSRTFYTLADGTARGSLPPPSIDDPDRNLDVLACVGSSGRTVLFANRGKLTAFDADAGAVAWDRDINGTVSAVDGYVVLTQGTSLTVLRPN